MKTVRLSILEHRGKRCIKIDFPFDDELKIAVDKIQGRKWSQTNKCWYVYDTPGNLYYARDKLSHLYIFNKVQSSNSKNKINPNS